MGNRIFLTMINSKCHVSVSIPKKGNFQRHFSSLHEKYSDDFPPNSKIRTLKLLSLKKELTEQQNTCVKSVSKPIFATVASLKITHLLTKVKKPFLGGELLKDFFGDFKNKNGIITNIKELQLSRRTITRQFEFLCELMLDIQDCHTFY